MTFAYVVDTITELQQTERTPAGIPLDQHEFRMLGKDHYILCGYVPERVTNIPTDVEHSDFGARVITNVIQEIKDGKVIFEWYSSDHPELYAYSMEGNDYFNSENAWSDYAHLNSIDIDPYDNNFICSFRNLDTMLKLDRSTGDILWMLGGQGDEFGLTDTQKTSRQHDFRVIGPNTYSVFDNGCENEQTRVLEYVLDETTKKLLSLQEYYLEQIYSPFQGNAQKLPGTDTRYLVSGGMWITSGNAMFYDIDFTTKEVLFEAVPVSPGEPYDMIYRAYRFDM